MNNKAEYNRCALPRLTAKLGEKELNKWRAEDREEMEKEATIEEKIRIRKKEKAKKRGDMNWRMVGWIFLVGRFCVFIHRRRMEDGGWSLDSLRERNKG